MEKNDLMDLDEIKGMIGNDVADSDFDLASIMAEVKGETPAAAAPQAAAPAKAAPVETAPVEEPTVRIAAQQKQPEAAAPEQQEPAEAPVSRSARRAAKMAEKQKRAEERRAEMDAEAAAALAPITEQASRTDEMDEQPRMTRAERRRAAKEEKENRRQELLEEEEEDIELRDPEQAQRAFLRRTRGLSFRSLLVLLLAAAAAYISFAPDFTMLPLPVLLDAGENPAIAIGSLLVLEFVAVFLGIDVFGLGFVNLFSGTPDRSTLVSVAVIASLLHGASLVVFDNGEVTLPYIAVSILMLYASMREERNRFAARYRAYRAISSSEQPMAIYSHYDATDDACRAVKGSLPDLEGFLKEMERPDTIDRFAYIYAPIVLSLAIILSLLLSVGRGQPLQFFWAFSSLMSVSAPLGLVCAFGACYKNVSRKLMGSGAALAGARQANELRGTEEVVLSENELFPEGAITLETMQNMGKMTDPQLLAYAAAMTEPLHLELSRVLSDAFHQAKGTPVLVRNLQQIEGGLTGEIGTAQVIIGTAALMVKLGTRMRPGQSVDSCNIYMVVDHELVGVLTLRYQPTTQTYRAMRVMRKMRMNVALATRDFNVTPAMVEKQFDMRRGFADLPPADSVNRMLAADYAEGELPAAILTREGAAPFVQVLRCCDKLAGAVRSNIILGAFAGICGLAIVSFLLFKGTATALTMTNMMLYLLLWYVPVFLITEQTH